MKKDTPGPGRSIKEIRELFGQIRGAKNQELATKAYISGMVAPYYCQLLIDQDLNGLTDAEKIEREWFGYGLQLKSLEEIELAQEFTRGVIRRRHN